jgi:hypothetical protein
MRRPFVRLCTRRAALDDLLRCWLELKLHRRGGLFLSRRVSVPDQLRVCRSNASPTIDILPPRTNRLLAQPEMGKESQPTLLLRGADVSRKGGEWDEHDYDVFAGERCVGRICRFSDHWPQELRP